MTDGLTCPTCGAALGESDVFCEACGAHLGDLPAHRPEARDHQELDAGWAAGVSDRGLHHQRNEDALFLASSAPGRLATVVCDGVSSSIKADVASQTAVDIVGGLLLGALKNDGRAPALTTTAASTVVGGASPADTEVTTADLARTSGNDGDLTQAMTDAVAAAQEAVVAIAWTSIDQMSAPSCTLVAAAVMDGQVTVCSVGDSRAYWFGSDGARQLTADDSWAGEQIAAGAMTESEAMADPRAHAITRWVGSDAPTGPPQFSSFCPSAPGRLLICSDGLWNYAPTPDELLELIDDQPPDVSPLALARALTDFALAAGGHDNITVVVADLVPASVPASTKGSS
jgi:serine/threonine protein phosphatase PrpC